MKNNSFEPVRCFLISGFLGLLSMQLHAAPGTLSKVPLYMGDGASPNVLWLLDDSASMMSEVTKRAAGSGYAENVSPGSPCLSENNYCNYDAEVELESSDINTKEELLEICLQYNALAYNPAVTYTPWVYADGSSFPLHDIVNNSLDDVVRNPQSPNGDNSKIDLSDAVYLLGADLNSNGKFDVGECGEDTAGNPDSTASLPTDPDFGVQQVSGLSQAEQLNYVTWYTYYRKRTYALKAALSDAIAGADDYFGLATINKDDDVAYEIADMTNTQNKQNIMTRLMNLPANVTSTPLQSALHNAGKYFNAAQNPDSDFVVDGNGQPANPIKYSCQANYTILMTDGYRNESVPDSAKLGDIDTDLANSDVDGNVFNGAPYGDGVANTMADIAMYYYSIDLDTNMANEVRSARASDSNSAQHMVTHAVTFGVTGSLDPGVDYSNWNQTTTGSNRHFWPTTITNNTNSTIDDLFHATVNGRGLFFNSDSPEQLRADIQSILESIASDTAGTAASVGFNSTSISAGSLLYQAWFNTLDWSGTLKAYDFSSGNVVVETRDDNGNILAANDLEWDAANVLDARDISNGGNPRVLLTWSTTADTDSDMVAEGSGVPFALPTDYNSVIGATATPDSAINEKHVNDLLLHSHVVAATDKQSALQDVVDWFNGDRTLEGAGLRTRGSRLGDIVYSSPQYVGVPAASYPDNIEGTDLYSDFAKSLNGTGTNTYERAHMVYVGSNDGMLHAFNAANGSEVFAYLPEFLFTDAPDLGIRQLAEPDYDHLPYQDGTATVADVFVDSNWKTYLVSGVNGGGKGIYVLDVTDPVAYIGSSKANLIPVAEFTHANLGYTYSRPQIAKMNNDKWAAIFGNGYNNTGHGQASLFIYFFDGTTPIEIATGAGTIDSVSKDCANQASDCNGLSSPSLVDLDGDYVVDRVYAGDVHGNMWAFDVSSTTASNWDVAHKSGGNDAPLFIACRGSETLAVSCTSAANRQPITAKPVIVAHQTETSGSTDPNLMVMFGTGQMIAEGDPGTTEQQSFYAVWDAGLGMRGRAVLAERTIAEGDATRGTGVDQVTFTARTVSGTAFNYNETATNAPGFGWYMNLITSGERMVLTPILTGNQISFVTTIPSPGICTSSGSGWLMVADIFSGQTPSVRIFNDVNSAIAGMPLDNMSGGMITIDNKYVGADSLGEIVVEDAQWQENRPSRRASWSIIR